MQNSSNSDNLTSVSCVHVSDIYGNGPNPDLMTLRSVQIFFGILYTFLFTMGMLGNISALTMVIMDLRNNWGNERRRTCSIFMGNLSLCNILLSFTTLPTAPVTFVIKRWYFGYLSCKLVPTIQAISILLSSLSLCCIAVDRYHNIVPVIATPWSLRKCSIVVAACWIVAIVSSIPLTYVTALVKFQSPRLKMPFCGMFCQEIWRSNAKAYYGITLCILTFALPLCLITYCYWKILFKVCTEAMTSKNSFTAEQAQKAAARKRHVILVLLLMVIAFVLPWAPITICNLLRDLGYTPAFLKSRQTLFNQLVMHAVAMTTVIWNPLLYFWLSAAQRKHFKQELATLSVRFSRGVARRHHRSNSQPNTRRSFHGILVESTQKGDSSRCDDTTEETPLTHTSPRRTCGGSMDTEMIRLCHTPSPNKRKLTNSVSNYGPHGNHLTIRSCILPKKLEC